TAPALCAISACFAVVTSMITPPLSISARPVFRRRLVLLCPLFCDMGLLSSCTSFYRPLAIRGTPIASYSKPELLWPQATAELSTPPSQHRACRGPRCARLGRARAPVPTRALAVHKSWEKFLRIDRHKKAFTAGQPF